MTDKPRADDGGKESSNAQVGKSATLISVLTLLARVAGLGRWLVLTWAIGLGSLGTVYVTASRVPNIIYELVVGGALASLVVPLLAAPLARRQTAVVDRTASGLLTWTLAIMVPAAVLVAVFADPLMRMLADPQISSQENIDMGARMLRVFAPMLPLYGVGVVLTGILHAHRRFGWPALAPLLSTLTVTGAYVMYALVGTRGVEADQVPLSQELVLSVGTTLAAASLSLCLFIPLRHVGIKFRPTLRFGAEVGRHVRAMAVAGGVSMGAWQLSLLLVLNLTNSGPQGTVGAFNLAMALYMLPWGVLAMPLAFSSYPAMSEAYAVGDESRYQTILSKVTCALFLLSGLGVAALAGLADPMGTLLGRLGGAADVEAATAASMLSGGVAALAPGLFGFALFALLTRALYARGAMAPAAVATVLGWAAAYACAIGLSYLMPVADRAVAVGLGNSLGMTVLGAALLYTVASRAGKAALQGVWRAAVTGVTAAVVSTVAGRFFLAAWDWQASLGSAIVAAVLGGCVILAVYLLVAFALDRRDMRPTVDAVWSRIMRGRRNGEKVVEK